MSKFATSCTPRAQFPAVEGSIASCVVPHLCHLHLVWAEETSGLLRNIDTDEFEPATASAVPHPLQFAPDYRL